MAQPEIIPAIVARHAEEAAFLWVLRQGALNAPQYLLKDLAKLDGRVEAHIDGLRIAGDPGLAVCLEVLSWNDAGEVFTAALLAFESGDSARLQQALEAGSADLEHSRGLVSALGWLPSSAAEMHLRQLVQSVSPVLQRVGLAGFAIHRQYPGDALRDSLRSEVPPLKARACKAVGELGRVDLAQQTATAMPSVDPEVRFWSAWSTALLTGLSTAVSVLQSIAESPGPRQVQALQMVARRSPTETKDWQRTLAQQPQRLRLAIIATGESGDPAPIPSLLEQMKVPPLARVAGEAFTTITGIDLAREHLDGKKPEGFESGPNDNPEDENVAMDEDENLPWPDPVLVQKWWEKNRGQFQNGTRYLLGKPMTTDWLKTVLRDGRQRQRAAAALELAIRNPGQPLFNVKAPGFRQIELLGKPGPVIR